MAKRTPREQSLFDDVDAGATAGGKSDGATPPPRPPAGGDGAGTTDSVALHEAAQARYLNYALSVITSRALPDVRDGLKPVQRRILYTMWQQNLTADVKHRKCAKVVGDVMGSFHPHGDAALYETLVRMAQAFSLRYPLVDGSGNFGSLDGDAAAAMRYTECRLAGLTAELVGELAKRTIDYRPNYDGTQFEPIVIPARLPQLGCQLDVAPTILGLIGRPYDTLFFGHDLLMNPPPQGRVLINHNRDIGLMRDDRMVVLSLNKKAEFYGGDPKITEMARAGKPDDSDLELEKDAIAMYQVADELYMQRKYRVQERVQAR